MQIEGCTSKVITYEAGEAASVSGKPDQPVKGAGAAMPGACSSPCGPFPLGSEEMIMAILGQMSSEVASQAKLDVASVKAYRARCKAMRKEVIEQMKKMKKAAGRKRRRGLIGKIFGWAAAVLGAIAAIAGSVFTGGGTLVAYSIAIAAAVVGCAGGAMKIAAGAAGKKEMEAGASMKGAQMEEEIAKQMQEELVGHMDDLVELDRRVGQQARTIMHRYDDMRQQSINWRN